MHYRTHTGNFLTATVLAIALSLAGCASTGSSFLGDNSSFTTASGATIEADPRLTQGEDAKFFSTSGLQACTAAAAVGILGCALSNSGNKAKCAILAGVAACGVAMGANYYLDQRRSQYSNTATRLSKITEDIQAETAKVLQRTATAHEVINDDKRKLAEIEAGIEKQTLDQQAARTDLARIDKNIERLRTDIRNMNKSIGQFREVAAAEQQSTNTDQAKNLDLEIDTMNQRVAALQDEVDSLYSQLSAITLG